MSFWPFTDETRLSEREDATIFPLEVPGDLKACNPSIAISDEGFRCIIRTINYGLGADGLVQMPPGGKFKSLNWIADLDGDFRVVDLKPIDDIAFTKQQYGLPERFEDCRLFRWKEAWWFSASWMTNDVPHSCKMALCRLDGARVAEFFPFESPVGYHAEKNWMPRIRDELVEWIYWIDPTEIVAYGKDGELFHRRVDWTGRLRDWRGSSQCVRYGGNWLCVVHLRKASRDSVRYAHRFVEFTDDFVVRRVSRPFVFEQPGVEFCAGLCLTDDHAILSYGVEDNEARLMRLSLSSVESMLRIYLLPRFYAVAILAVRNSMLSLNRSRWLRHPRKQLRAMTVRFRS